MDFLEISSTGPMSSTLSVTGVTIPGGHVFHTGSTPATDVLVDAGGLVSGSPLGSGFCTLVVVSAGLPGPTKGQGGKVTLRVVTVLVPSVEIVIGYPIGGNTILGVGWNEKPLWAFVVTSMFEKGISVVVIGGGKIVMVVILTV